MHYLIRGKNRDDQMVRHEANTREDALYQARILLIYTGNIWQVSPDGSRRRCARVIRGRIQEVR